MQSGSYEKATGTTYGWLSNEHASLPIDTRLSSLLHSSLDIAMIRMTPSLLTGPLLTTSQSQLLCTLRRITISRWPGGGDDRRVGLRRIFGRTDLQGFARRRDSAS